MKKNLLLLFLSLVSICINAQKNFESLLQDGKVWKVEYSSTPVETVERYAYEDIVLQGDTIIDGILFKSDGYSWIGQKDGVVYNCVEYMNLGQPYPYMDFSLNVGNEFVIYEKEFDEEGDSMVTWVVDRFEAIAVSDTIIAISSDKRLRHCVYVKSLLNNQQDCWVEGIGSLTYGILGYRLLANWVGSNIRLLQCRQNDEVLYYANDFTVDMSSSRSHKISKEIFFDLQGRRIVGTPKRGIYVKDGRKYVVK